MDIVSVEKELGGNTYPGRGIIMGKSGNGKYAAMAYFIMGRSVNSRNRIFVAEGDGIKTGAHDPMKLTDPSLVIYSPVRVIGDHTIVTNGDQTDTIYEGIKNGMTFEQSLRNREFEPDAPNYTPRISGVMTVKAGECSYVLGILKNGGRGSCVRYTFDYSNPVDGEGRFIHTYTGDGNPLPSFEGEPKRVEIPDDSEIFAKMLWDSLDRDNKISLFVRYTDIATGNFKTKIINKNL